MAEPDPAIRATHVHWPAIFGGAISAAAVSFTLNAFAAGVGLSVASTAPTWRDSSGWLWLVSGLYLLFNALCSFGIGGYIAGRMRALSNFATPETEFYDGMHGLMTWALAALFAAGLAALIALTANSTNGLLGSARSETPESAVPHANLVATELDELFRTERVSATLPYRRAEAARILLKASSHDGIGSLDRNYLNLITADMTGMTPDVAAERVDREIALAAQDIHRARIALVLQAFFIGAALFVGAAVAWFAAVEGGRDRERAAFPVWDWSIRRRV